jgi:hypothetical protein
MRFSNGFEGKIHPGNLSKADELNLRRFHRQKEQEPNSGGVEIVTGSRWKAVRVRAKKYPRRPVAALRGIRRAVYLNEASKIRPSISASIWGSAEAVFDRLTVGAERAC